MRDWGPIRKLHDQLRNPPTAVAARQALVAFAGADHGTDVRAWHEALRALLLEDTMTALDELGVLDDEVRAWLTAERLRGYSLDLGHEVRNIVANGRIANVWLPDALEYYGEVEEPRSIFFAHRATRTLRVPVTSRVVNDGIEVALGELRVVLSGEGRSLREQAFAGLQRWAEAHGNGRRFVLDEHWHAWLVDDAQLAAIKRYRVAKLRAFDATRTAKAQAKLERPVRTITPETIVPQARQWVGDGESVDSADDYRHVIDELCAIAELSPTGVSCTETSGVRHLSLTLGTREFRAELEGNTDWIDPSPLLACLNKVAAAAKKKYRFYEFREPRWGQELGIVFATAAEAKRLEKHGFLVTRDARARTHTGRS